MSARRRQLDLDDYEAGIVGGDRTVLARAITLIESSLAEHRATSEQLLERLLPRTGGAHRVGITGVPGVGKSTLIEALGLRLADAGRRVAVLAIDPSSTVSGGSILGDKTRMVRLSAHERAFVRPSPSHGHLGGVARATRETLLLCEAAGFDVVLIETVGVGQAEILVAQMVDSVLLLLLPGAGDELQGMKRGLLEWIDVVAVNKADGENAPAAQAARVSYQSALRLVRPASAAWRPPVLSVSGLQGDGLGEVWAAIEEHRRAVEASGDFKTRRRDQQRRWMWELIEEGLIDAFRRDASVEADLERLEGEVSDGRLTPTRAARQLLAKHRGSRASAGTESPGA